MRAVNFSPRISMPAVTLTIVDTPTKDAHLFVPIVEMAILLTRNAITEQPAPKYMMATRKSMFVKGRNINSVTRPILALYIRSYACKCYET